MRMLLEHTYMHYIYHIKSTCDRYCFIILHLTFFKELFKCIIEKSIFDRFYIRRVRVIKRFDLKKKQKLLTCEVQKSLFTQITMYVCTV